MKLTLCMIVKDEAENLHLTLDSAKSIADEIVLVDTGSTDGTLDVCRRYTDKVYVHPKADEWRERPEAFSFAEARQYALEQCTGDWILSLDADEHLDNPELVKPMLAKLPDEVEVAMPLVIMRRDNGTIHQQFIAERLFRRLPHISWQGAMHNWVETGNENPRADFSQIEISHNRAVKPDEKRRARAEQRIAMAEHTFIPLIEADPKDRRSLFYLAGTYLDAGRHEEAVSWYERYFEVSEWPEERYQAAVLCASALLELGRKDDAKRLLSANLIENYRRAEALCMLGDISAMDGDYAQAVTWYQQASLKPLPVDPMFVEADAHTWQPHVGLWNAYRHMGENQKAAEHGREAVKLGAPNVGEILRFEKNHTAHTAEHILCLVDRGQMDFLQPLVDHWRAQNRRVDVMDTVPLDAGDYDLIWCEWAGNLAVELTQDHPKTGRIIVRVHGYETHSGHIPQVNWLKVDDVIFVADYLRDLALDQAPIIGEACNVYVVPGGVETDKFSIGGDKTGTRLCMACYGNSKKNLPLTLQVMAALPDEYTLDIATEWQDDRAEQYFRHMRREMNLEGRVTLHPWQDDLNAFYADKDFYLSTSIEESFCYALAEGMAAGLKPVVHNWRSAGDFYKPEWIWNTVDEAVDMILLRWPRDDKLPPADCIGYEDYRDYAVSHLDISVNKRRIDRIIRRPSVAVCGEPKTPWAAERKIMGAFEQLGCVTDCPDAEIVFITGPNPQYEPWMDGRYRVLWVEDVNLYKHIRDTRTLPVPCDLVIAQNPHWVEGLNCGVPVQHLPILGAVWPFRKLDCEKKYDVGFYGAMTERRERIFAQLAEAGVNVQVFQSPDHEAVNRFINECRVIVNVHAYDEPILEWRLAECMAAGACVISEPCPAGHAFPALIETEMRRLPTAVLTAVDMVRNGEAGHGNHDWIWRNMRLEQQIEKLLELIGR